MSGLQKECERSASCAISKRGSKASSRASSAAPSAPRCSRSSSPASWPRRWTPTRPPRCRASTSPTSTRSSSPPGPHSARGLRALARAGALRLPARARAAPRLRPADPARGRVQDRRAAAARRVRDPDAAGQAAGPRGRAADAGRGGPHDGLLGGPRAEADEEPPARQPRWSRPARSSRSTTAATCSTARGAVSAARRRPTACFRDPNVSRRHAELRRGDDRRLADRRPRLDQRGQGQRPPGRLAPVARATRSRSARRPSSSTSSSRQPRSDGLRPDRSRAQVRLPRRPLPVPALDRAQRAKDLRRTVAPAPDATGFHAGRRAAARAAASDAWLVVRARRRPRAGERFDLFGGLSIGRSTRRRRADRGPLRLQSTRGSSLARRSYYVEDMNSTNGTLLNDAS